MLQVFTSTERKKKLGENDDLFTPILSTNTPPAKGRTVFGREYIEYNLKTLASPSI